MSKRKPLEVVRVVRERAVDAAATSLRDAADCAARANLAAQAARSDEARTREQARERAEEERHNLGAAAGELSRLAAFQAGNAVAIQRAAARAAAAERTAHDATAVEDRSRASLVEARTSLDIVEKHQARAREHHAKKDDEKLDELAADAFAARFGKKI